MNAAELKTPPAPDALLDVAERFGTPTYVCIEEIVRRQCARLRALVEGLPARLFYAMKANPSPAVLRVMLDEGLGLDVVSPGELALALRIGFAPEDLLFSANNMTDEEMHAAHEAGALLNIGERSRLEKFGRAYPGARVCLRLNPEVGAGHHAHVVTAGAESKFGLPLDDMEAARAVVRQHGLRVVGLHQHIGSGIRDVERFGRAVQVLLGAAERFDQLELINVGGGLSIPYRPGEASLDAGRFGEAVGRPLRDFFGARGSEKLAFGFEPGRFLVAEAGVLLIRVNTIKQSAGRTFAGTDSGMGHLMRPAVYGAYHGIYNLSNPDAPLRPYDVVGNICEAGDVFARARAVQEIREGDVLAILDTGAYGLSMASTYNLRPLPAEVMLRLDGTPEETRRRRTPHELADELLNDAPQSVS